MSNHSSWSAPHGDVMQPKARLTHMIPPTQITTKMNETNAKIYLPIDLFLPVFQSNFFIIYLIYVMYDIWYDPYDMRLILWGIINFPITVYYSKIFFHSFHSMKNVNVCWDLAVFTFIVKLEFLAPYESVKICESMNGFYEKYRTLD